MTTRFPHKTSINRFVFAWITIVASSGMMMTTAQATPSIMSANGAPACSSCHTGGAFTSAEGKAGLVAFLAAKKAPTCVAPQVLQNNVCVTPTTPAPTPDPTSTPTCVAPQVLQNNVCVTLTSAPTACGNYDEEYGEYDDHEGDDHEEDDHEGKSGFIKPKLSAPDKVSVHAGELLELSVTAFDCADRPVNIQALQLPKGAGIVNSIDPELHMPKAVISWTPSAYSSKVHNKKIVLQAIAGGAGSKKSASSPQTVLVEVLPPVQSQTMAEDAIVKANIIASARFEAKSQKLAVYGLVIWAKNTTKEARKAIIAVESAVITDAVTGAQLGVASVDKDGKWQAAIVTDETSAPCSVDVTFHGMTGVKAVKGVQHCQN